jgi:hypothetical protein
METENKNEANKGGCCEIKRVPMAIEVKMQAFYDEIDDPDAWAGKMLELWSEGRDLPAVISGSMGIDSYTYIKRNGKYHMTAIYKFETLGWIRCGDVDWRDKLIKETATRLLVLPCDIKVIA